MNFEPVLWVLKSLNFLHYFICFCYVVFSLTPPFYLKFTLWFWLFSTVFLNFQNSMILLLTSKLYWGCNVQNMKSNLWNLLSLAFHLVNHQFRVSSLGLFFFFFLNVLSLLVGRWILCLLNGSSLLLAFSHISYYCFFFGLLSTFIKKT